MNWEPIRNFVEAVISIFAIVNAIGNLPIFVGLTEDVPAAQRPRVLRMAGIVALGIILVLGVGGQFLMRDVFNVSIEEFMFGGGLILIVVGIRNMLAVVHKGSARAGDADGEELRRLEISLAVTPIACPLLVGPGSIVTVMLLERKFGMLFGLSATVVAFAFVILVLHYAHWVYKAMGHVGSLAAGRIMQIFIVALGVRFVFQAIASAFHIRMN